MKKAFNRHLVRSSSGCACNSSSHTAPVPDVCCNYVGDRDGNQSADVVNRSNGWLAKAAGGLPADKLEFYKQAKTEITYTRDGDQWTINVGIVGVPNGSRVFNFVMGQPYDSVNIDGTPLKSVITFEGGAFVEQHKEAGPREAEMSIVRKVNGNTMEVVSIWLEMCIGG
ncbi:hypothetical protein C0Q70_17991 [Pomacea canaliculata]|uniref:Uncharacterized protein n=1 Tax=Pomacea canaliculata TaxID=400727 RepID=A0A2T7NM03_POMCA|nr:hypothetical protein C0Q70_17991 [Pomacea canaliculata]